MNVQAPQGTDHRGLSSEEAARRLISDGPNALPAGKQRTLWRIVLEVLREPMLALLLGGGFVYLLIGDLGEALILIAFATFSVTLTVVQEMRTERVLEALRDLSAPRAMVIRDGEIVRIAGRDVVIGDLLVLEAGDRIAADAILLETEHLEADESLLTGESLPVRKRADQDARAFDTSVPGGDDQPFVYSGSIVVRGHGLARVLATGLQTAVGGIGKSLMALDPEVPRLRRETSKIVRISALGGATVALLVVLIYGLTRGSWLKAILAGITAAMTLLPEEFPVVLTVFMAMGAWRIGQAGVLTRRASAIETLGATTILCTDKTGTLTENRMGVARLWTPGEGALEVNPGEPLPQAYAQVIEFAVLASPAEPVDPMETAIVEATRDGGNLARSGRHLVTAHGFRADLLVMANTWREDGGAGCLVSLKGAPEAIVALCHLDEQAKAPVHEAADAMARAGIRVLGIARGKPDEGDPLSIEAGQYDFVGLVGLADPLRAAVPDAIRRCRQAGIRVAMITGDHPGTARAIAREAGLANEAVLTGSELAALTPAELTDRLSGIDIFARILPEQKLRLVEAYKARGEIVAMTGDGVNDAPSLKAAHIGIAMGKRGTDVAREAASIVLLEDDFASIVATIALGRRVYDNLRKAMQFIIAVHAPIAGLTLLPLFLGQPMLFGPIHIALLEMVIDPVCALVFEAEREEDDIMNRPPRDPALAMISRSIVLWSLFQGGLAIVLLAGLSTFVSASGVPEGQWRAVMFFALVTSIFALILVNRSYSATLRRALSRANPALWVVAALIATGAIAVTLFDPVRSFLRFAPLTVQDWSAVGGVGIALLASLEFAKHQFRSRFDGRETAT